MKKMIGLMVLAGACGVWAQSVPEMDLRRGLLRRFSQAAWKVERDLPPMPEAMAGRPGALR